MDFSPRLSLSYLAAAQSQKHVTVNETFRRLDQLVQGSVASRTTTAEPGSPSDGDAYIIPASATGTDWATFAEHSIAAYQDGAWAEIVPAEGWRVWVADDDEFMVFTGSVWANVSAAASLTLLGVNTTADATNRLAVKSDAVLFSHDDATPGNDDCQVKINKAAAGDTASLLFQTGASGRAEIGLTGADDLQVKVSPDNFSTTYDALFIDKDNGHVGVGHTGPTDTLHNGGTTKLGGVTGSTRYLSVDALGRATLRYDDNSLQSALTFENRAITAAGNGIAIHFKLAAGGATGVDAARIRAITENATYAGATADASLLFDTALDGSLETRMRIYADGGVTIGAPTGASKGAGALNAENVYDDNTLLSCYVFDAALDGAIDAGKWDARVPDRHVPAEIDWRPAADGEGAEPVIRSPARTETRRHEPMRKFAARLGGDYDPLSLDGYARHWKEKRHLTAMPNEATFDAEQGMAAGAWIQRLVETAEIQAVLIEKLNARLKALEGR